MKIYRKLELGINLNSLISAFKINKKIRLEYKDLDAKGNLSKMYHSMIKSDPVAQVVKLVDTRDLKSLEGNFVPVQVRPWAPS